MIIRDICKLKEKLPAAGVIVTHDLATIEKAADRVILLYNGDIVFSGSSQEFKHSSNPYAVQFFNGFCSSAII